MFSTLSSTSRAKNMVTGGFLLLSSFQKSQKNCNFITLSKRFHAFALVDQRYFSIDFATLLKLQFCIENQYKFFYLKINIFLNATFFYWKSIQKFLLNLQYILNLRFCIEKQYKCSHWKSIAFCQHHFPTENQYKIFLYVIF